MTDTYLQEQFIGKTFNDKLNDEIADYLAERKFSVLGFLPRPGAIAMVHTLEDGALKSLGGSDPFDIINDNFGKWLAAMNSVVTGSFNNANALIGSGDPPIDITNVARPSVYFYNTGTNGYNGNVTGESYIQIGSGVTAPLVSDFNIETPFVGGPEALRTIVTGSGAFNPTASRISIGTNIGPTTQAGTINELCIFMSWKAGGLFLMSHDAITPGVSFILGETIFAQYFFQI